jgi:hypothetical protein
LFAAVEEEAGGVLAMVGDYDSGFGGAYFVHGISCEAFVLEALRRPGRFG